LHLSGGKSVSQRTPKKSPFTRFAGKGEGYFFLFLGGVGSNFPGLINVLGGFVYTFL